MIGLSIWSLAQLVEKLRFSKHISLVITLSVLIIFLKGEVSYRYAMALDRWERVPLHSKSLEGMSITKGYYVERIRKPMKLGEYAEEVSRISSFFKKVKLLDSDIVLVSLTYDSYSLTELHGENAHRVFINSRWADPLYEDKEEVLIAYIQARRPLLEVPKNSSWADESHPIRVQYGISDYYVVAESNYGLDGMVQILAPSEFMDKYLPREND